MTARAIPSETLYRWREAIDAVLRSDDHHSIDESRRGNLLRASYELREAWRAALLAEERAADEAERESRAISGVEDLERAVRLAAEIGRGTR